MLMSSAKKIGFAVVGLGSIAQSSILPAFARSKHAKLVAVVSRDKEKAARLARKFEVKNFYSQSEYAACLANSEISAVYIATPPGEHAISTIASAEAGKHVLCEKPLAATSQQSAQMVEACHKHSVLLMTAYRKYFEPSIVYLKKLIQSGDLGRIDAMHTTFSELYRPGVSPAWLIDKTLSGGGPLTDLGVYCVNTTRWIAGENPVEASAQSWAHDASRFRTVEEGISFRLHFPSGMIVNGISTYSAAPSSFLYVQGAKGWAMLSPAYPFEEERHLTAKIKGRIVARGFKVMDEFAPQLDAFSEAIQRGRSIELDGREGHRDIMIIEAIYKSARENKPAAIGNL